MTLKSCSRNFLKNWPLVFSGAAYLGVSYLITREAAFPGGPGLSLISVCVGICCILFFCLREEILSRAGHCNGKNLNLISALSAAGICLELFHIYKTSFLNLGKTTILEDLLDRGLGIRNFPSYIPLEKFLILTCCILSFLFIYIAVSIFFYELTQLFQKLELLQGVSQWEAFLCMGFAVIMIVLMTAAFHLSNIFYASGDFDAIYSFDSSFLFQEDAYINLGQQENDVRQPLFSLFSAPFVGIPALIANVLSLPIAWKAVLFNAVQITMLLAGNFFLAKALCSSSRSRILFFLLISVTYPSLLFMLAMEQYVTAYFWLSLAVLCASRENPSNFVLWGAASTLLTSAIQIPINKFNIKRKKFLLWVWDCIRCVLGFLMLLVAFGRVNIIISSLKSVMNLMRFCGTHESFQDKLIRFSEFIENCFFPTSACAVTEPAVSWSLMVPSSINWIGILILFLAAAGFLCSRKNKVSIISGIWVLFSIAILLVMGLGYEDNGFILYGLYFSWAYFILLYQLGTYLGEKLRLQKILPFLAGAAGIILLFMNSSAILDLLRFGIRYYPA